LANKQNNNPLEEEFMIIVPMEVESILIFLVIIALSCLLVWICPKCKAFFRERKKFRRHEMLRERLLRRGATL
jgi:hypothetical protein